MGITNEQKNRLRDLMDSDISSAVNGTGNASFSSSDTSLDVEDATTSATPATTTGNKILNVRHILLSTVGNGNTYQEFGVKANSDSVLVSRVVHPEFDKTNKLELHTTTTYRFI